jgi:hypothetical protein
MRPLDRRPPRVVAWGGRPGLDLQVGSPEDRRRSRDLDRIAELARLLQPQIAALREAMHALGVSAAEAMERMLPAVQAMGRVADEQRARQLSGAAAAGRALQRAGITPDEVRRLQRLQRRRDQGHP